MLKRFCIPLVTALAAATLSMVGQAPANAVTYVEVSATGVTVTGSACKDAPIDIYGDWVDADVTVSVTDPSGVEIANDVFSDDIGALNLYIPMCGSDPAGTYKVSVEVYDTYDGTEAVGSDTFVLKKVKAPSKAGSRIVTKRKFTAGKTFPWLIGGKLLRSGRAYSHQRVILAANIKGDWYKIDAAKTRKGIVAWKFKPNNTRWRFFYAGNGTTKPSASAVFRTPGRGHGRIGADLAPESLVQRVTGTPTTVPQRHVSLRP